MVAKENVLRDIETSNVGHKKRARPTWFFSSRISYVSVYEKILILTPVILAGITQTIPVASQSGMI